MRVCSIALLGVFTLLLAACDTSTRSNDDEQFGTSISGPAGGTRQTTPFLFDVSFAGDGITVGSEVDLIGVNFSSDLTQNEVFFSVGLTDVKGLPLRVAFPSDGDPGNGLESRLLVVVPGGVTTGNVTLFVNGRSAGQRGYVASPQITAVTPGGTTPQEAVLYESFSQQFVENFAGVRFAGTSLNDLTEVSIEDQLGNVERIPSNELERPLRTPSFDPNAPPPSGLELVGFNLQDLSLAVEASEDSPRDNLVLSVRGTGGRSNKVQIPVVAGFPGSLDFEPFNLGLVIGGVHVPTGVRSGPIRIRYALYDGEVTASYLLNVEWKLTTEPDTAWRTALPDDSDPLHDGVEGILAGTLQHPTNMQLFPTGGAVRTFTWNAPRDPLLCDVVQNQDLVVGTTGPRRHFPIHFRLSLEADVASTNRPAQTPDPVWQTPPILYYYMEQIPGDEVGAIFAASDRTFSENFETDLREARDTTASWGPPDNQGALVGGLPDTVQTSPFGFGTFDLVLGTELQPDRVEQSWTIDTDRMRIAFNLFDPGPPADNGAPNTDPSDDTAIFRPLRFDNPGESLGEFHFRTVTIEEGTDVRVFGSLPLTIRVSGSGSTEDVAFRCEGTVDCSGEAGSRSPVLVPVFFGSTDESGPGGLGGPGGGSGGDGANLVGRAILNAGVEFLQQAGRGENEGGFGGESTGAVDFSAPGQGSNANPWGGPGGGGGHRGAGGDGDAGNPLPIQYSPPRGGAGGGERGDPSLAEFTTGSGGGGGGGTLVRLADNGLHSGIGGAGGGGGGGGVHIVVDGSVDVSSGLILANGGHGGSAEGHTQIDPTSPPDTVGQTAPFAGAGGGGSGGTIFLQTTGSVVTGCLNLQVFGGIGGRAGTFNPNFRNATGGFSGIGSSNQNLALGSGSGAPGYIRIEAADGGAPVCSPLAASGELLGRLRVSNNGFAFEECVTATESQYFVIADVSRFPSSGTIRVTGVVAFVQNERCREPEPQDNVGPFVGTTQTEVIRYSHKGEFLDSTGQMRQALVGLERAVDGNGPFDFVEPMVVLEGAVAPLGVPALADGGVSESPGPIEVGSGQDGDIHLRFISSVDPDTGDLRRDENGDAISIWTFDTDSGVLFLPDGEPLLQVISAFTNPGFIDATSLRIDANTVLRAKGDRPLMISVSQEADIEGSIDVSGFDGEILGFTSTDPFDPSPGAGGAGGPGGGAGGGGGDTLFRDGDLNNKDPDNTLPIPGGVGGLPPGTPPEWDRTPPVIDSSGDEDEIFSGPTVARATAGGSVRGQDCSNNDFPAPCTLTAGGGAGGGNLLPGDDAGDGGDFSVPFGPVDPLLNGIGGSPFGNQDLRVAGTLNLRGGTGGSGGGAHPQTSGPYDDGILDFTEVVFGGRNNPRKALHAPGTGGGGGGGVLYMVGRNIFLRATAKIIARGGNAFQSIDLGGNGGAGAGGTVFIRSGDALTVVPGFSVDVVGGVANRSVPLDPGQGLPIYEGNLNRGDGRPEPAFFGGVGGYGAPGRVRIEVDNQRSNLLGTGVNASLFSGFLAENIFRSTAVSQPIALSVGPGNAVATTNIRVSSAIVRFFDFGQPAGTRSAVLWQSANESLQQLGGIGQFEQAVKDSRDLRFTEYVRFKATFISNFASSERQSIREIELNYRYEPLIGIDCFQLP